MVVIVEVDVTSHDSVMTAAFMYHAMIQMLAFLLLLERCNPWPHVANR